MSANKVQAWSVQVGQRAICIQLTLISKAVVDRVKMDSLVLLADRDSIYEGVNRLAINSEGGMMFVVTNILIHGRSITTAR